MYMPYQSFYPLIHCFVSTRSVITSSRTYCELFHTCHQKPISVNNNSQCVSLIVRDSALHVVTNSIM
jgi:hypothetical protein